MLPGEVGDFAASGSAFDESFLYQVGFIDFLYRAGILAERCGYGPESYRTAFEFGYDGCQYPVVDLVQPVAVDVQGLEAVAGYFRIDLSVAFDLSEITHAPEQGVGNSRSSATAQRYFPCRRGEALDVQQPG